MSDLELTMMRRVGELHKENARLKAECQARQAENSVLAVECDSLKAEVERLTKDYDTINKDRALLWASHKIALQDIQRLHYALQAAKEGKQSK